MFISLDPPTAVKQEAAAWGRLAARANPGLRVVTPESIHLTLAFLGPVPTGDVGKVAEAIERSARAVARVEGGVPVWLPKRRPRALALEIREPGGTLDALRAGLIRELGPMLGWSPERSGFLPHLTVCRAGRGFRPSHDPLEPAPELRFDPEAITLYRSHLEPGGARYEAVYTLPLDSRAD
jgi:2'-5' RNA ligase